MRGGAATLFYPIWHYEVESLLVLKITAASRENRVRHLDYGVQINKLMYERLIKTAILRCSHRPMCPVLRCIFEDQAKFEALYEKYEAQENIRKKRLKAVDLFSSMMQERASTGHIYIQNVDHCNTQPF